MNSWKPDKSANIDSWPDLYYRYPIYVGYSAWVHSAALIGLYICLLLLVLHGPTHEGRIGVSLIQQAYEGELDQYVYGITSDW